MEKAKALKTRETRSSSTRIQKRNRKDIVDAAIEVIAEAGFDGARMETISERSGVSRTNIHYYFRTKEDLHREVIGSVLDVWGDLWSALDEEGAPDEELAKYVKGKLRASWDHPKLSRIFAAEILRGAPLVTEHIETEMSATFDRACKTLKKWMRKGQIVETDPKHVFFVIWGATQYYSDFGLVAAKLLKKPQIDEADYKAAEDTVTKMILDSLLIK